MAPLSNHIKTPTQSPFPTLSSHFQSWVKGPSIPGSLITRVINLSIPSWYVAEIISSENWNKFWVRTHLVSAKSVLFRSLNAFFHHILASRVALEEFNAIHILDCLFVINSYFSGRMKVFFVLKIFKLHNVVGLSSFTIMGSWWALLV